MKTEKSKTFLWILNEESWKQVRVSKWIGLTRKLGKENKWPNGMTKHIS